LALKTIYKTSGNFICGHDSTLLPSMKDVILTTPRLQLRTISLADLDFLAEMYGDPEVMRYYPQTLNRAETAERIEKNLERYRDVGYGLWIVADRHSGQPIGRVGPVPQELDGQQHVEVGYMIHRPFWRQGYAREAAAACHDYLFRTLYIAQIIALVRPENLPSQATARSLGMQREGQGIHYGLLHDIYVKRRPIC
jgi:ribosomal-protein-alanine N-acetyltransferase